MNNHESTSPISAFAVYQTQPKPKNKSQFKIERAKLKERKLANKVLKKPGIVFEKEKHHVITVRASSSVKKKKVKKTAVQQNGMSPKAKIKKEGKKNKIEDKLERKIGPTKSTNYKVSMVTAHKSRKSTEITTDFLDESIEVTDEIIAENPIKEAANVFEWLIAPTSPKTFFDNIWEQDVLYVKREQSKYYKTILSTERLDTILRENPLHYTQNVDVVSYENGIKEVHNQEGRAVPAALWDFYLNGCSIRVLNPQTYDQAVHLLISTLQEYFGTMVGTNVYLTPPGSQGFAPHYDDIEAFIVQLEGRKHWKLYKPKGSDVLARDSSHNFKPDELDDPFLEVTLNAGDLLYFPRGTIHEGRTDPEAHSLHITVSVYQHTAYADLLEKILPKALQKAAESDVEFRKGLPMNYLKHVGHVNKNAKSNTRRQVVQKVKDLMQSLINHIDVDLAADELGRKFMHDAMPPVLSKTEVTRTSKYDGDYMKNGQVFNRVEIGLDTRVRLLRYHCLRVVDEPSTAKLYYCTDNARVYHGVDEQWLEIDKNLLPCIKILQNAYPKYIEVEALPIEDGVSKVQLIADLWEKGLLVTEEPLPSLSENEDESDMEL